MEFLRRSIRIAPPEVSRVQEWEPLVAAGVARFDVRTLSHSAGEELARNQISG